MIRNRAAKYYVSPIIGLSLYMIFGEKYLEVVKLHMIFEKNKIIRRS